MPSISSYNSNSATRRNSFDSAPSVAQTPAPTSAPKTTPSQSFQDKFSANSFDSGKSSNVGQDLAKVLKDVAQVADQLTQLLKDMHVPELGDSSANSQQAQGSQQSQGSQGAQGGSQQSQGAQGGSQQSQGTQGSQQSQGAQGGSQQSQGTQGSQQSQGAQGGSQQTQGTQAVQGASKTDDGYGVKDAVADIDKLSTGHQIGGENRGVGDANRAELDKNKTAIAEAAIDAAKRYFPEMSVKDGTRLILSDASLESTFNPKLNAESGQVDPDKTVGLLQARGESSLADFKKHASGEGLKHADGSPWDPKQTQNNDLAKIWENIHVGAWYMSTTARLGATSPNEHFDMGKQGPRQTDVTTGLLSHFMGPGGAAENKPGQNEGADRYLRIVGGEMNFLDPNSSQRALNTVLDPKRVV